MFKKLRMKQENQLQIRSQDITLKASSVDHARNKTAVS